MKKLFVIAGIAGMFMLGACNEGVQELKETIYSAEDNAVMETEFLASFDVADDVSANNGRQFKKGTSILPSGAKLELLDSSFDDGDGLEMVVDFGELGDEAPKGLLCKDGKYRAGVMRIMVSKPYAQIGTQVKVSMAEDDSYYSGNGVDMVQLIGDLIIERTGENILKVNVNGGVAKTDEAELTWTSERIIERTLDANGIGVWGDHFKITGSGSGTNRNNEDFTIVIDEPLIKKVEIGCACTFVKGIITLNVTESDKSLTVDFDPFKNEACDRTAEADLNGKKKTFTVSSGCL